MGIILKEKLNYLILLHYYDVDFVRDLLKNTLQTLLLLLFLASESGAFGMRRKSRKKRTCPADIKKV